MFVDARGGDFGSKRRCEREVGINQGHQANLGEDLAARIPPGCLEPTDLTGLCDVVVVVVAPCKEDPSRIFAGPEGINGFLETHGPAPDAVVQVPGIADQGHRPSHEILVQPPDPYTPILVESEVAIEAVCQVGPSSERNRTFGSGTGDCFGEHIGTPVDTPDRRFTSLPVECELDSAATIILGVEEAGLVVGVDRAAAAVLRRAVPGRDKSAVGLPQTQPLGIGLGLRNPETPPPVDRHPAGVAHPALVVAA